MNHCIIRNCRGLIPVMLRSLGLLIGGCVLYMLTAVAASASCVAGHLSSACACLFALAKMPVGCRLQVNCKRQLMGA